MSYNGVGLSSVRGTGTSGHVQKNIAANQDDKEGFYQSRQKQGKSGDAGSAPKKTDPEIVDHEKRRAIEVRCVELEDQLEDEGLDEEQIRQQVMAFKEKLLKEMAFGETTYERRYAERSGR